MFLKLTLSLMISLAFINQSYAGQADRVTEKTPSGAEETVKAAPLEEPSYGEIGNYPSQCMKAVRAVSNKCWKIDNLDNMTSQMSKYKNDAGLVGNLKGVSNDAKTGGYELMLEARNCKNALSMCEQSCMQADINNFKPQDEKDDKGNVIVDNSMDRLKNYENVELYCGESIAKFKAKVGTALALFNESSNLKDLAEKIDTGKSSQSFYDKHQTAINLGGAAAIGTAGYMLGKNKGKDEGKKSAIANLRYNCFNEGKWDSPECKREYVAVCSENPKAEGCYAFTNTYCGINGNVTQAAGADTQFCDSMNAYRYCQEDGAANSPTCVERRVQAGTCQSDKAVDPSLECRIYNHQQLAQQVCQSYPSDPLCRRVLSSGSAYGSTAPSGGTQGAMTSGGGNGGVMGYAMSSSSSKVIPNNQRQPSSSGDVSCAACASVFSQISRVAQEYCQTGQLYGCYQK